MNSTQERSPLLSRYSRAVRFTGLLVILLIAATFRFIGSNWDQSQHLHPDERFMTMVVSAMEPVGSVSDYFDTAASTLNPNNRGYTFYVYGDLPIILVRYAAEGLNSAVELFNQLGLAEKLSSPDLQWILSRQNWAGYDEVTLVGRAFAAIFDLASLLFVFLIAKRLFSYKVGALAALFAGISVMLIQQAHFFTVDSYANFFMTLTVYFAVELIFIDLNDVKSVLPINRENWRQNLGSVSRSKALWLGIGFGVAFGAAMACKINAAPLAFLLPLVFVWRAFAGDERDGDDVDRFFIAASFLVVVGGLVSILIFRATMPYAFEGPGFFNFKPAEHWIQTIQEQRAQASGDVDFPPALQWARRSFLYSGKNLLLWGTGIPLGLAALFGFLGLGWRIFVQKKNLPALLVWVWVAFYFLWQSTQWNPTMRYQLPIYPLIVIFAAWFVFHGEDLLGRQNKKWIFRAFGVLVLILTAMWAFGFTRIYTQDHSRVRASDWIFQNVPGAINIGIRTEDGALKNAPQSMPAGYVISDPLTYDAGFLARETGMLERVSFGHVVNLGGQTGTTLKAQVFKDGELQQPVSEGSVSTDQNDPQDPIGSALEIKLIPSIKVSKDEIYFLRLSAPDHVAIIGSAPVHETSWDDGLPLRMNGYDPYGGIYQGELNLELYWNDDQAKYDRLVNTLDAGDYIFISSNRQWGTTTRLPERYPLTSLYYRELLGCPPEIEILTCYNIAEPGMYSGELGFELVKTFTSYPTIFGIDFNTQFADEAFTVYDAPKVLIFKKTASYDGDKVAKILATADLSKVVHVTPRKAADSPGDLMMSTAERAINTTGGTWSALFSYNDFLNKFPVLGLLVWYITIFGIGAFTWPILFALFKETHDGGYAASRLAGLLFSAFIGWVLSSLGVPHEKTLLWGVYALLAAAGIVTFARQRAVITAFIKQKKAVFLTAEVIFFVLFAIDLAIRLSNPDLWHPYRGGERPMDFSFLNAVIKTTFFPPYDPWMAGGYINYYYYGFVIVSVPVKALGIVPSIAYNFILPTLFATVGVMAAAVVWNLALWGKQHNLGKLIMAGIAGAAGTILIGNLGTVQLIFRSLQKMVVSNELVDAADTLIFSRWAWALQGLGKLFQGQTLPIGVGDYYWAPSRVMPFGDLAITEFPLFTFLYSDLHAHMIALPITIFVLLWAVVMLRSRKASLGWWAGMLALGGFLTGTLKPTNTWDYPTYLILALIITLYAGSRSEWFADEKFSGWKKWVLLGGSLLAVYFVGKLVTLPFDRWYGLGYSEISVWKDNKTPIWSTLTHWGFFFFIILFWMGKTTIEWMANTPVSALNKLKPYRAILLMGLITALVATLTLQIVYSVSIAWFLMIFAVWVLFLLFRHDATDAERFVLFLIGTGLMLNLMVEVIVLSGDIGRMNTVFKFYYQAWTLFAISAAVIAVWMVEGARKMNIAWRSLYELGFAALFLSASMFTFTAVFDKARDRMSDQTGFTFDSIDYMKTATYWDQQEFFLGDDYAAIRWLQDNVTGSPVIIEANTPEYRWGTRVTIYTGLPGVVGWNWHMRQQRALTPSEWVTERVSEVGEFYQTEHIALAKGMLEKYDIGYIVVGELEKITYPASGLDKFERYDGVYWNEVFRSGDTRIYEVAQ